AVQTRRRSDHRHVERLAGEEIVERVVRTCAGDVGERLRPFTPRSVDRGDLGAGDADDRARVRRADVAGADQTDLRQGRTRVATPDRLQSVPSFRKPRLSKWSDHEPRSGPAGPQERAWRFRST